MAPDTAVIYNGDNDTPVQSQSEREKTVAGNEDSSGKSRGSIILVERSAIRRLVFPFAYQDVRNKKICLHSLNADCL